MVHVSQLTSILNSWIVSRGDDEADSGITPITPEEMNDALQALGLERSSELSCSEFVSVCDYFNR